MQPRPYASSYGSDGTSLPLARADAAYEYLREGLLEGPLAAGERLSVVDLARTLGCSRVPVMEALKRLAGEGFVQIVPQVGCHVVTPRRVDVQDFFVLFAAVEATVTGFAAARRDADDLREFAEICARIDTALTHAKGPGEPDPTYRRLNVLFHDTLHRMARSPLASAIARGLWDRSDFYIKLAFGSLYFSRRVRAAHAAIRVAVEGGDAGAAEAATHAHLRAVGEAVAARFAERETQQAIE